MLKAMKEGIQNSKNKKAEKMNLMKAFQIRIGFIFLAPKKKKKNLIWYISYMLQGIPHKATDQECFVTQLSLCFGNCQQAVSQQKKKEWTLFWHFLALKWKYGEWHLLCCLMQTLCSHWPLLYLCPSYDNPPLNFLFLCPIWWLSLCFINSLSHRIISHYAAAQ